LHNLVALFFFTSWGHSIFQFFRRLGAFGLFFMAALDSSFLFLPFVNDLLLIALVSSEPRICTAKRLRHPAQGCRASRLPWVTLANETQPQPGLRRSSIILVPNLWVTPIPLLCRCHREIGCQYCAATPLSLSVYWFT